MGKRTRLQKVDNSHSALVVSSGIFDQQSARHQKISRKENAGSVVVKRQVGVVMSRRGNYVHRSATQIEMGNPVGPVTKTEESSNAIQIYGTTWTDGRAVN